MQAPCIRTLEDLEIAANLRMCVELHGKHVPACVILGMTGRTILAYIRRPGGLKLYRRKAIRGT